VISAPIRRSQHLSRPDRPPHLTPSQSSTPTLSIPAQTDEVRATPLARRAAAIKGVDLRAADGGSGAFVQKVAVATGAAPPAAPGTPPAHEQPTDSGAEPLRGPAAALVDYMERSREIPTATSFRSIGVTVLDARRRELNIALSAAEKAGKVSFTHLIGYAIARAAAQMPEMTAHFARDNEGKPLRVPGAPHLGLAVDSRRKDGTRFLVVPVIRDAGTRLVQRLSRRIRAPHRARADQRPVRRGAAGRHDDADQPRRHRHRRIGASVDAGPGDDHRRPAPSDTWRNGVVSAKRGCESWAWARS